ncbi:MAG: inorganic phosphate transporter, partial [Pseudomonadota bacterium]|nr:inorganic phosphate transporter [Pseudomonadota bacterium]
LTSQPSIIPFWILQLGASGVVLGLITYGYKIMDTVGSKITQLTPSRGFVAQFTTSAIIMIASSLGLPVSTTQTIVGAILGVGIARGFMALNMKVIRGILISWFITVPAGMILAMIFFLVLQGAY